MAREVRKTWPEGITIMMPRARLQKWLAALRSGRYKQATGALRGPIDEDDRSQGIGYCCLGVLCHISGVRAPALENRGMPDREELDQFDVYFRTGEESEVEYTFDCQSPTIGQTDYGSLITADSANDDGRPFSEIADMIERCSMALEDRP